MKKQINLQRITLKSILITLLLLAIPFFAMQFGAGVAWEFPDFLVMGSIIMVFSMSYGIINVHAPDIFYRIATILSLATMFLLIWANLAVGLIGGGAHAGNLLYIAVIIAGIIGGIISRFSASALQKTCFVITAILVLIAIIALLSGMQYYPGSSVREIILVNGIFGTLFFMSGVLFRIYSKKSG